MSNEKHTRNDHGASKLEKFNLGFEINRTLKEERKLTKQRTHSNTL